MVNKMTTFSSKTKMLQLIVAWIIFFCVILNIIYRSPFGFYWMQHANSTEVGIDFNSSQQLAKMIEFWDGKPFAGADNYIQYQTQRFYLNSTIKRDYEPLLIDIPAYRYPISVPKCLDNQGAFIAVISAADNFEKRETIRRTWLRLLNSSYTGFAFVVALTDDATIQQRIEKESEEHGDIIQINFKDDYYNLTLKAVGLLNWVHINCPRVSFFLKCDDDVYINLPNLYAFLGKIPSKGLTIYGNYLQYPPQRCVEDKWYLSTEEWPWSHFPSFLVGRSVLITGKSIKPLLDAAKLTPFFWLDDVYLFGIVAEKAGVNLYGSSNKFFIDNVHLEDSCLIRMSISWYTYTSDEMKAACKIIEDVGFNTSDCYDRSLK